MKITKFFVAALASLAMFSCSNDEEMTNDSKHQNTALSVSVANIMNGSRAVGPLAQGDKVYVDGTATLTIDYSVNSEVKQAQAELTFKDGECTAIDCKGVTNMTASKDDKKVTLWNVGTVTKVAVTINNGVKEIPAETSIENYVGIPAKQIPAYAEVNNPAVGNNQGQFNNKDGNTSAVPDYENYYFYDVTIQPKNTEFARIELSDIYFQAPTEGTKFQTLELKDVVLDNAIEKKGGTAFVHDFSKILAGTATWGLYHDAVATDNDMLTTSKGNGLPKPVSTTVDDVTTTTAQSFGYNFWAGQMPVLRLHFHAVAKTDAGVVVAPDQWAFVTEYQTTDGTKLTAADFVAGKIFRIKSAKIEEKNITPDPDGDKQYAIIVTVEPAEWAVTDINAVWNETETPKN